MIDTETGAIRLAKNAAPIRPLMPLQEFLETFEPLGAFRDPVPPQQLTALPPNPFPTCRFDRTFCINDVHFTIAVQFSDVRSTLTPVLRHIRLFATRSAWKRGTGVLFRLRRFFSPNPLMVGLPETYRTMDEQRSVYEKWLFEAAGQTVHEQQYCWGHLKLLNSRQECYHLQFDFAD